MGREEEEGGEGGGGARGGKMKGRESKLYEEEGKQTVREKRRIIML